MDRMSSWCRSQRRLEGLTAIVTGCNAGIGMETARDLYLRGARVIMACRDITKANTAKEELENTQSENVKGSLAVEELDLSSLKSVREFSSRVLATETQVNMLINNAGVMCCDESRTEDGFEMQIGTNHFGHALLTLLLLPRIIKSAPARIVFLSSAIHKLCNRLDYESINLEKSRYNKIKAYVRSKAANILFSIALARKLKEHGIKNVNTYSLHPGAIRATSIGRHMKCLYRLKNLSFWPLFLKSPRCGAQTTIYCAVDDACANESGLYYSECRATNPSRFCRDENEADKLWQLTIELLKLQNYNPFAKNS